MISLYKSSERLVIWGQGKPERTLTTYPLTFTAMPTMRVALQRLPSAWATTPEGNCLWRLQKKRPLEGGGMGSRFRGSCWISAAPMQCSTVLVWHGAESYAGKRCSLVAYTQYLSSLALRDELVSLGFPISEKVGEQAETKAHTCAQKP